MIAPQRFFTGQTTCAGWHLALPADTIRRMFRFVALGIVVLVIVAGARFGQPDEAFLLRQWVQSRLESVLRKLAPADAKAPPIIVAIDAPADRPELAAHLRERVRIPGLHWADAKTAAAADHVLSFTVDSSPHSATIRYRLDGGDMVVRRVGWYSVLPPLLAVIAAIMLRRVVLCLALGVLAGGVVTMWPTDHSPFYGLWHAFNSYLIHHAIRDQFRIEIIIFVLLITAVVGIAQQSGGIQGMIDLVVRVCKTARSAQIGTALVGLLLFFDDYINCIVVGNALRPLTDRYRVSREKLAYLVDSTAAPVAGLALVSTWIAFEITQISEGLRAAGLDIEPFSMFVSSLPYRFYCMLTLVLVFVLAWSGREFGPMLAAERRARATDPTAAEEDGANDFAGTPKARYAIVPIGVMLVGIFIGLWWTAQPGPGESSIVGQGANVLSRSADYVRQVLARTNSARAFSRASAIAFVLAVLMVTGGGALTLKQTLRAAVRSCRIILTAIIILFLAWSIGAACRDVGTADYLVALFRKVLTPVGFSLVVFGMSCLISFSTGSSYSTMAILLPNVVPLAYAVGEPTSLTGIGLATMSVGAVLEGAIFGDHCSPISDTTILSSISSQCDLMEHVRTQMPYAITSMLIAAVAGYIPVAMGAPPFICLGAGVILVMIVVRLLGRRVDP